MISIHEVIDNAYMSLFIRVNTNVVMRLLLMHIWFNPTQTIGDIENAYRS